VGVAPLNSSAWGIGMVRRELLKRSDESTKRGEDRVAKRMVPAPRDGCISVYALIVCQQTLVTVCLGITIPPSKLQVLVAGYFCA